MESVSKAIATKLDSEKKQSSAENTTPAAESSASPGAESAVAQQLQQLSPSDRVAAAQEQLAAVKSNIQSLVATNLRQKQLQTQTATVDTSQNKELDTVQDEKASAPAEAKLTSTTPLNNSATSTTEAVNKNDKRGAQHMQPVIAKGV